jgi:cyclic beta-1,2-glucan synthetase
LERAWECFSMLNPIHHAMDPKSVETYKVEPYVMAADIYAVSPHTGRGGWTWYTGSAGWMYRLAVETLLGLHFEINKLRINPRIPDSWESFKIHYRYHETFYHITIKKVDDKNLSEISLVLDGAEQNENMITLINDQIEHQAEILIPKNKLNK